MDDDSPTNVITFVRRDRPKSETIELPPLPGIVAKSECRHLQVTIDSELPIVECTACKERLDPYVVIRHWTTEWARWVEQVASAQRQAQVILDKEQRAVLRRRRVQNVRPIDEGTAEKLSKDIAETQHTIKMSNFDQRATIEAFLVSRIRRVCEQCEAGTCSYCPGQSRTDKRRR